MLDLIMCVILIIKDGCLAIWSVSGFPHRMGSSDSSLSYWSRNVLARKKMTPEATNRNPATEAIAMPTTSGSDTYSSQCSPLYHQFSPTRHLRWRWICQQCPKIISTQNWYNDQKHTLLFRLFKHSGNTRRTKCYRTYPSSVLYFVLNDYSVLT